MPWTLARRWGWLGRQTSLSWGAEMALTGPVSNDWGNDATWTNWGGNQTADCSIARPRGTAEIAAVLGKAAADDRRVKPIGSGHSFSGIARPEQIQLRLDRHADLVGIDTATGLVTVQAGMPLYRLNALLAEAGLALSNLGDIDRQTVAGAMATGTHGTGARFGGLSSQVRELELVLANGEVLVCSPTQHPEVFSPARVNLGALGVVSTLTLQTVPAFAVRAEEFTMPLAEVLQRYDEFADGTDHFEFYWFPHTAHTLVKRNTRLPPGAELAPLSRLRAWWDDDFLSNTVFGATVALGRVWPALIRPINRISARALGSRTFTGRSDRVFVSDRRVKFIEMEYAVPRAAAVDVVTAIRAAVDASDWSIGFPIEVRVVAADDVPLSMAHGRDSAYIAVHSPLGVDYEAYFAAVEQIMADHDGRPHWGKRHSLGAEQLSRLYPGFGEFVALRDRLDPDGRFANAYLDRVLGTVGDGK
jgi:L-gulonolactone oxidase